MNNVTDPLLNTHWLLATDHPSSQGRFLIGRRRQPTPSTPPPPPLGIIYSSPTLLFLSLIAHVFTQVFTQSLANMCTLDMDDQEASGRRDRDYG